MRLVALALLAAASLAASAGELRVLSAGAVEEGVLRLADRYRRDAKRAVTTQFGTSPELEARLSAGDTADVLIAPLAAIERAVKAGRVVPGSQTPVARVGIGVAVRTGAAHPDVATVDALRSALLRADSVVYNQASTGQYLEKLFARMGILEGLERKTTRYGNAQRVLEHVIAGSGSEIGFGPITEIKSYEPKGLVLVAPLPAEVQNYTTYAAAVMTGADAEAARAFIRHLTTPAARETFAETGVAGPEEK